jgi:hypothetical protein
MASGTIRRWRRDREGVVASQFAATPRGVLAGKFRDVSVGMYVLALPLAYYFWTVVGR